MGEGVEMGYSSDRNTYGVMLGVYKEGCDIGTSKTNISAFQCQRKVSSLVCLHEDDSEIEQKEEYFHTPAFGRLVANVSKGADKIVIEPDNRRPATFEKGQKIMIAIQKSWLQNETKIIKAISGGEITLDSGLKFDYSARDPVIQQHPKNELLMMDALEGPALQVADSSDSGPFTGWATAMLVMGCISGGAIGFFANGRSRSKARGLTSEETDE